MKIIEKQISELKPYDRNPRLNDDAVKYVANSIKEFGWKVPIVIDKNNVIVAGHTRYKAALELNIKDIPCVIADDLTEEQIKAYRLADNKVGELAEWDFNLLNLEMEDLSGIDMSDFGFDNLDFSESESTEIVEDDYNGELPTEPKAKLGDIYQLGKHRLMCGDSTNPEFVKKLTGGGESGHGIH